MHMHMHIPLRPREQLTQSAAPYAVHLDGSHAACAVHLDGSHAACAVHLDGSHAACAVHLDGSHASPPPPVDLMPTMTATGRLSRASRHKRSSTLTRMGFTPR